MESLNTAIECCFFTSNTFFSLLATVLILYCFYDTCFQLSKKKLVVLLIISILDAVLVYVDSTNIFRKVSLLVLSLVVVCDYQGKKTLGFIRYFLLLNIFVFWINNISRFGYCLMYPEKTTGFYAVFDFIFKEFFPAAMNATDFQDMQDLQAKLNELMAQPAVISDAQYLFNYICGTVYFGFSSLYLYRRLYRHGIVMRLGARNIVFVFCYPTICLLLTTIFLSFGLRSDITIIILSVLVIALALIFPLLICNARITEYHRTRTAVQEQHIQAELVHFRQYQQMQEETSRFRHDIRNNLLCVNDMLQQGKPEEAAEYLQGLMGTVENLSKKYVTGDALLDSIVGVKVQAMEQHGIRFELDGVLAGGLSWKPMDICNVFANALDNAIEACQKVAPEKRNIRMRIRATPQFWFVTIENSVSRKVDTTKLFQKNGGYTSKANSSQHGIGTYSMKYTVESYGAMIQAECTEEVFKLEIMLDKSSPE